MKSLEANITSILNKYGLDSKDYLTKELYELSEAEVFNLCNRLILNIVENKLNNSGSHLAIQRLSKQAAIPIMP